MKRYIFAAVLQLFTLTVMAVKTEDLYVLYNRSDGSKLYYIREQVMTQNEKEKGQLTYDITYIDSDTLSTWRFSVIVPTRVGIDSVGFQKGGKEYTVPCSLLYVEPSKKNWEHRIETTLPYSLTKAQFTPEPALQIVVYRQGRRSTFMLTPKKDWISLCASMRDIFWTIENNRH